MYEIISVSQVKNSSGQFSPVKSVFFGIQVNSDGEVIEHIGFGIDRMQEPLLATCQCADQKALVPHAPPTEQGDGLSRAMRVAHKLPR